MIDEELEIDEIDDNEDQDEDQDPIEDGAFSSKDFDPENFDPNKKYTPKELELIADAILRADANRELCPTCKSKDPDSLPYGNETGHIEWKIQLDKSGVPLLDDNGDALYIGFPELKCSKGHSWYKGTGKRRHIRGPNPILFENHLYHRRRREIQTESGTPDPAYTTDRWGKRPVSGMYFRSHPDGRKVNSEEQRKKNGMGWYR